MKLYPGDTVTLPTDDGLRVGVAATRPYPSEGDPTADVTVWWEDTDTYSVVPLDELHTEVGGCQHGHDPSGVCGRDAAPGFECCSWHGGRDPLPPLYPVEQRAL